MVCHSFNLGNFGTSEEMAAVGLGTILANVFGFMVIENLSVGFSVVCSYFTEKT